MMKEMLAVWEDGPDDPIQRFVLLTIADSGMDPKTISLSMLSERTAIAESLLADLLRDLRDDQWVSFPHGIHTDEPFECNLNLNQ